MANQDLATKGDVERVLPLLHEFVEKMEQGFNSVDCRFDTVDWRLQRVDDRLDQIGSALARVHARMVAMTQRAASSGRSV